MSGLLKHAAALVILTILLWQANGLPMVGEQLACYLLHSDWLKKILSLEGISEALSALTRAQIIQIKLHRLSPNHFHCLQQLCATHVRTANLSASSRAIKIPIEAAKYYNLFSFQLQTGEKHKDPMLLSSYSGFVRSN